MKNTFFLIIIISLTFCFSCLADKSSRSQIDTLKSYMSPEKLQTIDEKFFTDYGFRDWWRLPLVYPYQIEAIDSLDFGELAVYKNDLPDNLQSVDACYYIKSFCFDKNYLLAQTQNERENIKPWLDNNGELVLVDIRITIQWIIYDFNKGKLLYHYDNEKEMISMAKHLGFTKKIRLNTLREYHKLL